MSYRELIFKTCVNTDLNNKEDVTSAMQYLTKEAVQNFELCGKMESKLKEIMTAKDFEEWSSETAREMFKAEVESMPEGEFKDFCKEHFGYVTSDTFSWSELKGETK